MSKRLLVVLFVCLFAGSITAQVSQHADDPNTVFKPLKWRSIGPFRGGPEGRVSLDLATPLEDLIRARRDGGLDVSTHVSVNSTVLRWRTAQRPAVTSISPPR